MKLLFTLLTGLWMFSSCSSITPVKKNVSSSYITAKQDYIVIVRSRTGDYSGGPGYDVFDQVQKELAPYGTELLDRTGFPWGTMEIKLRLHSMTEKMINNISSNLYNLPNVIEVSINRE